MKTEELDKQKHAINQAVKRFPRQVFDYTNGNMWTEKRMLMLDVILNRTNEKGEITISGQEISCLCSIRKGTFYRFIEVLEECGVLTVERSKVAYNRNAQNIYKVASKLWFELSKLPHIARRLARLTGKVIEDTYIYITERTTEQVSKLTSFNKDSTTSTKQNFLNKNCRSGNFVNKFEKETKQEQGLIPECKDIICRGVSVFDASKAEQLKGDYSKETALKLILELRSEFVKDVMEKDILRQFEYNPNATIVHFLTVACKVAFTNNIRRPNSYFILPLVKNTALNNLLESLEKVVDVHERVSASSVAESKIEVNRANCVEQGIVKDWVLYKFTGNLENMEEKSKRAIQRMRSLYGETAYKEWLSKVKFKNNTLCVEKAPRGLYEWLDKQYLAEIIKFLEVV